MSCPHSSVTDGYCDACGIRMTPAPSGPSVPLPPPQGSPAGVPCPNPDCGAPVLDRFCEECGTDIQAPERPPQPFTPPPEPVTPPSVTRTHTSTGAAPAAPAPDTTPVSTPGPAPPAWTAIVWADPAYYQAMVDREVIDATELSFPQSSPQRRIPLAGTRVHIGRRSRARGVAPEIDLAASPGDPAVSARHAVLLAQSDGSWVLRDEGSTNGTKVNDLGAQVEPDVEVPLADGDRIYLGAWTVITMQRG